MTINGYQIDWMAISAIATLIMALATFLALWQSRKQLAEMKRQWDEEQKPNIDASFVINDKNLPDFQAYIQLINFGKGFAGNLRVRFIISPEELAKLPTRQPLDKLPSSFEGYINGLPMHEYNMLPNSSLLIPIVDIKKTNSDLFHFFGKSISKEEVNKIEQFIYFNIMPIEIIYGTDRQYRTSFLLSYSSSASRLSTIQGELNSIKHEISLLRNHDIK